MAEKKIPNGRIIEELNSYVEGSVNLDSGDFVGGDKIVGMSSREVIEFIEAIKRNLTPKYLNPSLLDQTLEKFRNYHQELYEWKELHNGLDEVLYKFNQFYTQVHRLNGSIIRPSLKSKRVIRDLRLLWNPACQEIDDLLAFSKTIRLIGAAFQEIDGQLRGEQWAIEFYFLRGDMQGILYSDQIPTSPVTRLPIWQDLYDLTENLHNKAMTRLHWGDKKLRETAAELFNLSTAVFQR